MTTGPYLGHAQVTVDTDGCFRWLDRHGHVRLRPHGDPAEVAVCVIEDRAGTISPPEPDPFPGPPPPAPLPRRGDRHPTARPLYRTDEDHPTDGGPTT